MANGLNARQTAFLAAYIGEARGVGSTAARMAGYTGTDHSLRTIATRLLTNVDVAAAIVADKARVRTEGIASREERIKAQHIRWEKMHQVIEARADDYATEAPGSDTGILVRQYKMLGSGPLAREVEEWVVDTGLLAEIRQLEQHTAKELGQWVEKTAPTTPDGDNAYASPLDDLIRRLTPPEAGSGTAGDSGAVHATTTGGAPG